MSPVLSGVKSGLLNAPGVDIHAGTSLESMIHLLTAHNPIVGTIQNVESAGSNIRIGGEVIKYAGFAIAGLALYAAYKNRKSVAGLTGNILKGLI